MSQIQFNENENVAFLPAVQAVVNLPGLALAAGSGRSTAGGVIGALPSEPVRQKVQVPGDERIAYWGDGNDFPQQVIARASKNTVIPATLSKKAALWIGGGVFAAADETSQQPVKDPDIQAFMSNITTKRYLLETALDIAWFVNAFPEFILSKNREKIVQLHANETAYCRWGRMDEKNGEMDRVYLNANWPQATATDPETISLPCINPYRFDRVNWVRGRKDFKFIYPLSYPSPGKSYYQLANWDSARSGGWLDVLEAIPQFKKYAMENQMSIKYHIEVPQEYWSTVYGERWKTANYEGKRAIRDEFLTSLMDRLTNVKNAHKGIITDKWFDIKTQQWQTIVINVLDDKHMEGKYNEDYTEGNANLFYALEYDPTMSGFAGGSKMGSRSGGSDKREAFWIFLSQSKPYRDRIIEPFDFVAEYNGWKQRWPELTFKFRDTLLTTLDTGHSTADVNTPAS
ncbi:hypothetical protein [Larkinella soli]|uniref:hypothetical protein n=1 Tax=Larkinella soli TaxID=1770527 RepID=UPI000FFBC91A|nr:hypothetical protein [Larkinella soli]